MCQHKGLFVQAKDGFEGINSSGKRNSLWGQCTFYEFLIFSHIFSFFKNILKKDAFCKTQNKCQLWKF